MTCIKPYFNEDWYNMLSMHCFRYIKLIRFFGQSCNAHSFSFLSFNCSLYECTNHCWSLLTFFCEAFEMAAISTLQTLQLRDTAHQLAKRNWAGQEAGVIVVFCIVFVVAVGLLYLCVSKYLSGRKAARPQMWSKDTRKAWMVCEWEREVAHSRVEIWKSDGRGFFRFDEAVVEGIFSFPLLAVL